MPSPLPSKDIPDPSKQTTARDDEAVTAGPINGYAATLEVLASSIGLPTPTLDALVRAGRGPPTFKIGRRVFGLVGDFHGWLDAVAAGRIDATLTGKRRHLQADEIPAKHARPKPGRQRRTESRAAGAP